jgi:NAD(P)-dependent dehydrogenase (short-subunit alcohol dehydrogenase family)
MPGTLEGKVMLVTGGASGIGRATCLALAREGAQVVVADVDESGGEETVGFITQKGGQATFIRADITDRDQVEALIQGVVDAYGRLDGAFNNAGVEGRIADTIECSDENFDRTIDVNVKGVWLCMRAELRQMRKQGNGGAIVNTSSVAGLVGFEGLPAYVASKHAVIGLTKTAALEFAKEKIRVNAVCPGAIDTPMMDRLIGGQEESRQAFVAKEPIGRFAQPGEIGEAVAWLLSDAASFVTGVAMPVDGGMVAC